MFSIFIFLFFSSGVWDTEGVAKAIHLADKTSIKIPGQQLKTTRRQIQVAEMN